MRLTTAALITIYATITSAQRVPAGCAINFNYCNNGEGSRGGGCEFTCPTPGIQDGGLPYEGTCYRYEIRKIILDKERLSDEEFRNGAAVRAKTGVRNYCGWPAGAPQP
jgi:hypothetical protein